MKTARFVKRITEGWRGEVRLYLLSEPAPFRTINRPAISPDSPQTSFVIVSAVEKGTGEKETIIFPAFPCGQCIIPMGMAEKLVGQLDHDAALKNLGYVASYGGGPN